MGTCPDKDVEWMVAHIKSLEKKLEIAKEALVFIQNHKDMTRLADCCVEKSCHINSESRTCSFQTGVHYGNSDRAGDVRAALEKIEGLG